MMRDHMIYILVSSIEFYILAGCRGSLVRLFAPSQKICLLACLLPFYLSSRSCVECGIDLVDGSCSGLRRCAKPLKKSVRLSVGLGVDVVSFEDSTSYSTSYSRLMCCCAELGSGMGEMVDPFFLRFLRGCCWILVQRRVWMIHG